MKILWANLHCLSDTTNGACRSISTILNKLAQKDNEIIAVTAANFDVLTTCPVTQYFAKKTDKQLVRYEHSNFTEIVMKSGSARSDDMTNKELWGWLTQVQRVFNEWQPDIVMSFGARVAEQWLYREAKLLNIPTVAYLVNENYKNPNCFNYVSKIITDSQFTANLYRTRHDLTVHPFGKFIDYEMRREPSSGHSLTFINPILTKGALLFSQIVQVLRERGFTGNINCVSGRASLVNLKNYMIEKGYSVDHLNTVTQVDHTDDVRSIYRDTKLLIVPSLWKESGARVIAEAQCMGIPVLGTDIGGNKEMIGDGGAVFQMPTKFHEEPYDLVPNKNDIEPFVDYIENLFTDSSLFNDIANKAILHAERTHCIERNTERLNKFLNQVLR
ncbi:glycosyltransferase [Nereida sp. NH-UV-3]|uniref:glycosyltransferase n=1 Tax=Nereida TaxID=282198 RepID=UPI0036F3236D